MSFDWHFVEISLDKIYQHFVNDLIALRVDGANSAILDSIVVNTYGTKLKIQELAQITIKDANLIIVTPYDTNVVKDIEKAIIASNLNLNPLIDNKIIKITIPFLTHERRQQMVKLLHQKTEESKIQVRNWRARYKKEIENQENISEDLIKLDLIKLEKKVKDFNQKVDLILKKKETSILSI